MGQGGAGARGARGGRLAALAVLLALAGEAQAARLVSARGGQEASFGRIVLTFDAPVPVKAKLAGTVLVLTFGERTAPGPERIAAGMPDYVSVVRRDPDGTALRLALQRPYRIHVQEAGEQVFVDLLPERWSGLPPPLPTEVVAELARRAREAEAALRARSPAPVVRTLPLELAHADARARLSLRLPPEAAAQFDASEGAARLTVPGPWRIEDRDVRGRLDPTMGRLTVENGPEGARILAVPTPGHTLETGRDGETATIDFVSESARAARAARLAPPAEEPAKEAAKEPAAPSPAPPAGPVAAGAPKPAPAAEARPALPARKPGGGLFFPFGRPVPAALFERGNVATLVFETTEPVNAPEGAAGGLAALGPVERVGGFAVLRFPAPPGHLVDLVATTEPMGWELVAGEGLVPSEALPVQRLTRGQDRLGLGLPLPEPGGAVWLEEAGARIGVVTARPGRRAGVAKPQRFVDFELLPSRIGVAVLAHADDLGVRPDLDGVALTREGGLALTGTAPVPEVPVAEAGDLAIVRETWNAARQGNPLALLRARAADAADAGPEARGSARFALAEALMANGLDAEAIGVLGLAAEEDPVMAQDRRITLLRGIALARMGRAAEARPLLSSEGLAANPEARLWRGYGAAEAGRPLEAGADLAAGAAVLARYPDDVAARLHATAAEAAAETGDWEGAARAGTAAIRGASPLIRDRLAFLRARADEAAGRGAVALESYEALAEKAERPVAAAATLRAAVLARALGRIDVAAAIDRLERLVLTWHGGPTEIGTLSALGGLYAEAGRWRQVFLTARRANALDAEAPAARALHAAAQTLFETLYLGENAERVGGIEGLALYFDFKDLAPTGRRADEIVRKLADRLVALDLLDSAADLLRHQIEHRLTGPARAAVSARLATIRLMEGRPLDALQTLEATHTPGLADDLRRARALLRARALSDLSRSDLALETVQGEAGADVERLRADILWAARRWREAGEAHEALLGEAWRGGKPLDDAARADVIRAAIAYGLSEEALGLERLKAKFAAPMAESADARTFALLTRTGAARTAGFREVARRASTAETLAAFLTEYRRRYPEAAVPERGSAEAGAEAGARAAASADATPPG